MEVLENTCIGLLLYSTVVAIITGHDFIERRNLKIPGIIFMVLGMVHCLFAVWMLRYD